jgi:integrase
MDPGVSELTVDPLRTLGAVAAVKELLRDRPRDLLLFSLGINSALRAGDLLRITVNGVRQATCGETFKVREKRSGELAQVFLHPGLWAALQRHLAQLAPPPPPAEMYLFASQPGWTPLTVQRLDGLVREWTAAVGLQGRFGAHSLRKTFGYLQRTVYGVGFDVLAERFRHPSPQVTMRYLGLSPGDGRFRLAEL